MKQQQTLAQKGLAQRKDALDERIGASLAQRRRQLLEKAALLDAYSPLAVLKRGYSITVKDGHVIRSAAQLACGDHVSLRFGDGMKRAVITEEEDDAKEGII